ncbi:MAG: C39 family peptidase [Spirochaetes bacterium]|nr:C39 family peptidase [Spirochaetota bacterium]MBU1081374.1 C39 family peptidase [Spirochaetota bacterium]
MDYRTGFSLHRAVDGAFSEWTVAGCSLRDGRLELDAATAGAIPGETPSLRGEALSPELASDFPFRSCVPSWNADAPDGSWLELSLRARSGGVWSSWRTMGAWAPGESTVRRHSVEGQDDAAARVSTDTFEPRLPADAFQARFYLFAATGPGGEPIPAAMPAVRAFSLAYSDPKPAAESIEPSAPLEDPRVARGLVLGAVPRCSQMVYPNGGNVWCSPTSVSMVLGYWRGDQGPCESRVRAAVAGVYDHVYEGHGNWSFNAAYAGSIPGMEAYVARFSGLDRLEPWIAAGVPVVLSVSWNNDEGRLMTGAPVAKTDGHLTTLVGFDDDGNAVMNEPASPSNETVRRTYDREELEVRWLSASGGVAYVIFPSGAGASDRARVFASTIG